MMKKTDPNKGIESRRRKPMRGSGVFSPTDPNKGIERQI